MAVDIIAESQTESVLSILDRGDADDKVRDQVSAALLRALTRVSQELTDIKTSLWQSDDLRRVIDERHDQQCKECPAKRMAEERLRLQQAGSRESESQPQGVLQWILHLAGNSGFQFFILMILLISSFVYLTTGKGGVEAAKGTVNTVLHGGVE